MFYEKIVLLALASLAIGTASAQEVTYVEDCSQGLLMNRAKDNWFITAQGGTNIQFGHNDIKADLKEPLGRKRSVVCRQMGYASIRFPLRRQLDNEQRRMP